MDGGESPRTQGHRWAGEGRPPPPQPFTGAAPVKGRAPPCPFGVGRQLPAAVVRRRRRSSNGAAIKPTPPTSRAAPTPTTGVSLLPVRANAGGEAGAHAG